MAIEEFSFFIKKHGLSFAVWVLAMNILDEFVLPLVLLYLGHPIVAATSVVGDLDFITYPAYFVFTNIKQKLQSED